MIHQLVSLYKKFKRYIEKTWIVQKLDVLSVHGVPHRTNNSVESYNRHWNSRVDEKHPNFWVLAEHIWETFEDVSNDMGRLNSGNASLKLTHKI